MATSLTASTQAAALGYASQNKVAVLCDGSLLWVDESGTSTNTQRLYQITTPTGTPTNTQVTGFAPTLVSGTQLVSDILTIDTGAVSTEVWIAVGGQAGAAGVQVWHATYTASGSSWSAWDNGTVSGVSATTGDICSIVWTGTYLITAWRDVSSRTFTIHINYTTTKSGASGWQASSIKLNTSAGTASHNYVALHHDSTLAATVAILGEQTGANGTEFITSRVLSDAFSPASANWGPETSSGITGLNLGSDNLASILDHTTGRVHVAWCDSTTSNTKSPGYIPATVTVDAVTVANNKLVWGTAIAAATASTTAAQPSLTVDGNGTVYLFWETAAVNAAGAVDYVKIAPPYTSATTATAVPVPSGVTAQYYPHVPNRQRAESGYIPLVYQTGTASPYTMYLDTSIVATPTPVPTSIIDQSTPAGLFVAPMLPDPVTSFLLRIPVNVVADTTPPNLTFALVSR